MSNRFCLFGFVVWIHLIVWIHLFVSGAVVCAQEKKDRELKPGRLPSEIRKSLKPGVLAEYFSPGGQLVDSVRIRALGLLVEAKEPMTPFLNDKIAKVRLSGYLKLKLKGEYRFALRGNGRLSLSINNLELPVASGDFSGWDAPSVNLVKGYNHFEAIYFPPEDGPSQLRIYWDNESFQEEPLPPTLCWCSPAANGNQSSQPVYEAHRELHEGRNLVLKSNCLKCHQGESVHPLFAERDTPNLSIAAKRLNPAWVRQWLLNPAKLRNDVTMPSMIGEGKVADNIARYLDSLSAVEELPEIKGDVDQGGDLFENIGCVGCHHFEEPDHEDDYDRISLHFIHAKYRRGQLAEFLKNPRAHYRWSRMPMFRLTEEQATQLAAFIRSESKGQVAAFGDSSGDANKGKLQFVEHGCANCHSGLQNSSETVKSTIKPFAELSTTKGCLAPQEDNEIAGIPDYRFEPEQTRILNQYLSSKTESKGLSQLNYAYFAHRQLKELRCTTCHDLDDEQATLPYIIEEEGTVGLPPNRVPMLTYAGEKLMPNWSEKLISGELPYRVREHFRVVMPAFPVRGKTIARGLSQMHGFARDENAKWQASKEEVEKGKKVAAMETGLSCNRCHAIADRKPNAAFDAQSTNLIYAAVRLRKEYYLRWMFDPLRIDKQTKMPKFSEDGKKTSLPTIEDGDAHRQYEALWQYLNSIRAEK